MGKKRIFAPAGSYRPQTPKVSVVIPMYNSERWIDGALQSVLAQTFRDFEVIVVDDGSLDGGARFVRQCRDLRIRLVQQENRGLAGARNTGIRNAKGRYIAFLDADDLWQADKLAKHVAALDSNQETGISFSWSTLIDLDGKPVGLVQKPGSGHITPAFVFCRNPIGNGSAPVVRRNVFDSIEFAHPLHGYPCWFDEAFRQSEDIECWTRIALTVATRFSCIDEPLTLYRVSQAGLSADTGKQFESWTRFYAKMADIDPEFVSRVGPLARTYQQRYLARRAIFQGRGSEAVSMIGRALRSSPRILLEEPGRTIVTIAGALACLALPVSLVQRIRTALLAPRVEAAHQEL
jgi:glycosyltransferase involved in cell wall biosynthesis